ncbi:hypothetical protein EC141500_02665 [Escherichia coli O145:H28]|nr:hypothetical protein EC141500_02665 [Escherichia coli O145:H28]
MKVKKVQRLVTFLSMFSFSAVAMHFKTYFFIYVFFFRRRNAF